MAFQGKSTTFAVPTSPPGTLIHVPHKCPTAAVYFEFNYTGFNAVIDTSTFANGRRGMGFANGPLNQRACATFSQHGITPTSARLSKHAQRSDCCVLELTNVGSQGRLKIQSVNATEVVFVIDVQFGAALQVHMMAFDGSQVAGVKIGTVVAPAATGNQDITGLGVNPTDGNALLRLMSTGSVAEDVIAPDSTLFSGAMVRAAEQFVIAGASNDQNAATTACYSYNFSGEVVALAAAAADSPTGRAVASWLGTGFRLNWSEVTGAANLIYYAVISGPRFAIRATAFNVDGDDITITGLGFQPECGIVLTASHIASSQNVFQTDDRWGVGYWDGANQVGTLISDLHAQATSRVSHTVEFDNCILGNTGPGAARVLSFTPSGLILRAASPEITPSQFCLIIAGPGGGPGPPPPPVGTTDFVSLLSPDRQSRTGSTNYADILGAVIPGSALNTGDEYLILVTALFDASSADSVVAVRLVHGATAYADSERVDEPDDIASKMTYPYFSVITAQGDDIKLQFATAGGSAQTVGLQQLAIIMLNLTALGGKNVTWFYAENNAPTVLGVGDSNGAAITFTPAVGAQQWGVLAAARFVEDGPQISWQSRLQRAGEAVSNVPEWIIESEDGGGAGRQLSFLASAFTLGAVSNTFREVSKLHAAGVGGETRTHSKVFAFNLAKFQNAVATLTTAKADLSAVDYATNLQTRAVTPAAITDTWCLGYFIYDGGDKNIFAKARLRIDAVDSPPGQSASALSIQDAHDNRDQTAIVIQTVQQLSAAAHSVTLDGSTEAATAGRGGQDRLILAIPLAVVGAAAFPIAGTATFHLDVSARLSIPTGARTLIGEITSGPRFMGAPTKGLVMRDLPINNDHEISRRLRVLDDSTGTYIPAVGLTPGTVIGFLSETEDGQPLGTAVILTERTDDPGVYFGSIQGSELADVLDDLLNLVVYEKVQVAGSDYDDAAAWTVRKTRALP